jgi:tight adherence protein B
MPENQTMVTQGTAFAAIEPEPDFAGILRDEIRYSSRDITGAGSAVNGWYDRLMLQSGISVSPAVWLMLCVLTGVSVGGLIFVLTEIVPLAVLGGLFGIALPLAAAAVARSNRQKQIRLQLPEAAEELARAARSGRNVESALHFVAGDTVAPLGDELRLAVRRVDMGIDVAAAVRDLPERTGVTALTMLTSSISLHQDTGGDLVQVLERLAASVRDRMHFVNRMRAATISSRMALILMVVIPPLIIGFYVIRDPQYLTNLMSSFWGRLTFWSGVVLQIVGALMVFNILRKTARY